MPREIERIAFGIYPNSFARNIQCAHVPWQQLQLLRLGLYKCILFAFGREKKINTENG